MQVDLATMPQLAQQLMQERKRQRLSRAQAAAVCNVSASFIRDAESDPAGCSLRNLLQLTQGLGLQWALTGWQGERAKPKSPTRLSQMAVWQSSHDSSSRLGQSAAHGLVWSRRWRLLFRVRPTMA